MLYDQILHYTEWKHGSHSWEGEESMGTIPHSSVHVTQSFFRGPKMCEDEPCSGRPSPSKIEETVRTLMHTDWRITLRSRMFSSELNLNHFTIQEILTQEQGMRKVHAKIMPKTLSFDNRQSKECVSGPSHLHRVVCIVLNVIMGGKNYFHVQHAQVKNGTQQTHRTTKKQEWINQVHAHLFFWQWMDCS